MAGSWVARMPCLASHVCRMQQSKNSFLPKPSRNVERGSLFTRGRSSYNPCRALQATATKTFPGLSTLPWDGTQEQIKALKEVEDRMKDCPYGTPIMVTQQWFLRDRAFNVEETVHKLTNMMRWRRLFRADEITAEDVAVEAATGKAYLHKHLDVNGRPVIVVKVQKHVTGEFPLDESQRLCTYLLESAIEALPPGNETLLGVFDLRGFGHRNADLGFVRFLVDIFFTYYPKRLGQVVMVEAPWLFQPGWEMVKPWLKKYAALVRFVSLAEFRSEFFTPSTIPEDFR